MTPGVLLSTGYIAGGAIGGVLVAFLYFSDRIPAALGAAGEWLGWEKLELPGLAVFGALVVFLFLVARGWLLQSPAAQPKDSH